jgi:acyl carrier protein
VERSEVLQVLQEKAAVVLGVDDLAESDSFEGRGVDSLAVVELVMDLEDAYGVELAEHEVAGAATVGDLVDLIRAKAS